MISFQQLKERISPRDFSKGCLGIAALWLLLLHPLLLWFCPQALPSQIKSSGKPFDVDQYYAGAVVVREHLWDSLYAMPKPEVYHAPSHFVPEFHTFLFNPVTSATDIAFYPEFNTDQDSLLAPKLRRAFPEAAYYSYIYPPPTALLCSPLALFDFDRAAMYVWPTLGVVVLFVLAFFSSQIYRLLKGGDTYGEGIITLACLGFAVCGQTDIPLGNVTPVLAGCVACCCYALMRSRLLTFSCAFIPLILFKAIGLAWLPLLLLNRSYWRALIYLAAITLVLNGTVMQAGGLEVYQQYFSLLPLISIPLGTGIERILIVAFGFYPHQFYIALSLGLLALLYLGYLKNGDKGWALKGRRSPMVLGAFLAGTLAVFCLLNNIVWPEYAPNYLFAPLLGWAVQEGNLSTKAGCIVIRTGLAISYFILISQSFSIYLGGEHAFDFFTLRIIYPYAVFIVPAFFLLIALRRLLVKGPVERPLQTKTDNVRTAFQPAS